MSRIGKKEIIIPDGVTAQVTDGVLVVKGPKGELKQELHPLITVDIKDGVGGVSVPEPENKTQRSLWGLFASLFLNMVEGVTKGYEKKLEVHGVGYKVASKGNDIELKVGFSHPVLFKVPEGITVAVEKNNITVSGIDKQLVGEVAAQIRKIKKPEPYKGKGIRYAGEQIRRKAGKTAAKA